MSLDSDALATWSADGQSNWGFLCDGRVLWQSYPAHSTAGCTVGCIMYVVGLTFNICASAQTS